jgi:hypothetical protein
MHQLDAIRVDSADELVVAAHISERYRCRTHSLRVCILIPRNRCLEEGRELAEEVEDIALRRA